MEDDEKIRKSYNKYNKMYRYVRVNKKDGSFRDEIYKSKDINEYTSLYDSNIYNLEYKPYKPYWFFRLKWLIKPLIIKFKENISVVVAKNKHLFSVLKWIFAIVSVIASIKYIIE